MVIDRGWCYLLYVLRLFHMLPRLGLPKASIGHRPNSSVVISSTDSKAVGVSAYSRNQIVFVGGGVVFGGWGAVSRLVYLAFFRGELFVRRAFRRLSLCGACNLGPF